MKASDWYMDLIFPTPIWWTDTNIDNSVLKRLALKLKEEDPVGRVVSNLGGWQSKDIYSFTHKELIPLKDIILEQANRCLVDYGYCLNSGHLEVNNFWININYFKDSNVVHFHDRAFVSGVYYIDAETSQGAIDFVKNSAEAFIVCSAAGPLLERTNISCVEQTYEVKTGRLILFPSSLMHRVTENVTKHPRISISWNVRYIEHIKLLD
jgi:uncharacterized protein (TIGR02466 family)